MNLFSSLVIVDLTRVFSGPFCTRHFADFGATVIKIEPPQGDDSRHFEPIAHSSSGYFELLNRNKESIVLNLKEKSDLQTFYKFCAKADVLVENFSPQVKATLNIDYDNVCKIQPSIIYASISGISEHVNRKYYDIIAQAESGLASLNGKKDDMKNATSVVDAFAGMKLAYAISSALYSRERTGKGCKLNISMKGSAFDLLEQNLIATSITGNNPKKVGNMDSAIAPFGLFKTKDTAIAFAIGSDEQWSTFLTFAKEENQALSDTKFATNHLRIRHIQSLKKELETVFKRYSSRKLLTILDALHIPCGNVNTMQDVLADQENYKQQLLQKVAHSRLGTVTVPTGGIFYSDFDKEAYKPSPNLDSANHENS